MGGCAQRARTHCFATPLFFRDVGVLLVSDCGAHCESAGTSRQFHECENDGQVDRVGESNALNRIPKRILEQIMTREHTCAAIRGHRRGEDAQNPQEDDARREG